MKNSSIYECFKETVTQFPEQPAILEHMKDYLKYEEKHLNRSEEL